MSRGYLFVLKGAAIPTDTKIIRYSSRFICMVTGAACLLTFSFILSVGGIDSYFGSSHQYPFYLFGYLGAPLLLAIAIRFIRLDVLHRIIGAVNAVFVVTWVTAMLFQYWAGTPKWLNPALVVLLGVVLHTFLIFQWNMHFTLNKVEEASQIIWVTTALSVIMIIIYLSTDLRMPFFMVCALPLASAACCIYIEVKESANPDSPHSIQAIQANDAKHFRSSEDTQHIKDLFFRIRIGLSIMLGIASGIFSNFYGLPKTNNTIALAVTVVFVIAIIVLLVRYQNKQAPMSMNIVLPFLIAFALISVYLQSETVVLSRVAIGIAWTVANVFSLYELPSYREMTKLNLVQFAFLEKAAMIVPFAIAGLATSFIIAQDVYPQYSGQVDAAIVYYMLMMVIVYGVALTRHLLLYYPRQQKQLAIDHPDQENSQIAQVSEQFALTKREGEVLYYLARGYSRPYIEKKLFISKGTAKTHIFRIFQKIGVTSQDELIELVETTGPPLSG